MPSLIDYYILLNNGFSVDELPLNDYEKRLLRAFCEHETSEDPLAAYRIIKKSVDVNLYTIRRLYKARARLKTFVEKQ